MYYSRHFVYKDMASRNPLQLFFWTGEGSIAHPPLKRRRLAFGDLRRQLLFPTEKGAVFGEWALGHKLQGRLIVLPESFMCKQIREYFIVNITFEYNTTGTST